MPSIVSGGFCPRLWRNCAAPLRSDWHVGFGGFVDRSADADTVPVSACAIPLTPESAITEPASTATAAIFGVITWVPFSIGHGATWE